MSPTALAAAMVVAASVPSSASFAPARLFNSVLWWVNGGIGTAGCGPGRSEHRHRQERPEIVVGRTEPRRQQPGAGPEHLVRDVTVEVEEEFELRPRDREQHAGDMRDGVGGPLGAVEDRHVAEAAARFQHRQRFLAGARDGAADPHFTGDDDEEAVPRFPLLEDGGLGRELLLLADLGHARQFPLIEVGENGGLLEQFGYHGGATLWKRPGCPKLVLPPGGGKVAGLSGSRTSCRWRGSRSPRPSWPFRRVTSAWSSSRSRDSPTWPTGGSPAGAADPGWEGSSTRSPTRSSSPRHSS